ncbi:hypothetical protein PoB_002022800 [Plakobranchus ocellatus]|uniref:Uncharacterized protein n=1 Tax=Plakobranchus ocellatus TaxID=259542 RepID=A0AAV3ZG02_9GAST|nr:hypothetical protein PoB_002022800 [Plakobranchus ocellatus]
MATRVPRRGITEENAKLVRIDHSDVYFVNERLDQELTSDLDFILRKKHRQRIALDSEISQLKKACKPRKITHHVKGRVQLEEKQYKRTESATLDNRLSAMGNEREKRKGNSTVLNNVKKQHISERKFPLESQQAVDEVSIAEVKSENLNQEEEDDIDESISSSSGSDDDNDSSSESDDYAHDNDPPIYTLEKSKSGGDIERNKNKEKLKINNMVPQDAADEHRSRDWSSVMMPRVRGKATKTKLKTNLAKLKLDAVPYQWYSSVVPPRDCRLGQRLRANGKSYDFKFPSTGSRILFQNPSSQPTNASSLSKQTDKRIYSFLQRPQTSIGLVSNFSQPKERQRQNEKIFDLQRKEKNDNPFPNHFSKKQSPCGPHHIIAQSACQTPRAVSIFEKTRPKTTGKSRRQLREEVQEQLIEAEKLTLGQSTALKKRCEDTAAQQLTLDLRVKDFLHSLDDIKKSLTKKDILDRIIDSSPLGYYTL